MCVFLFKREQDSHSKAPPVDPFHPNYPRILIGTLTGILLGKPRLTRPTLYRCPRFRFVVCLDFKWNLRWRERWNVCFSLQKGAGVTFQSSPCGSFPLYVLLPMSTFQSHYRVAINQAKISFNLYFKTDCSFFSPIVCQKETGFLTYIPLLSYKIIVSGQGSWAKFYYRY